ncbi:hypothetical protein QFZ82_006143 [Streptomyces sp. V4I23]|nr:hypothetical protein [Streptomyces sp. V4I23]
MLLAVSIRPADGSGNSAREFRSIVNGSVNYQENARGAPVRVNGLTRKPFRTGVEIL